MDLMGFMGQPWVGTVIGLASLALGLVSLAAGFAFYRLSRTSPKLNYVVKSLQLIGRENQELPEAVEILYKGTAVTSLAKSEIMVWNSGNSTVRGEDIVAEDPLRFCLHQDACLLDTSVVQVTREVNKFSAHIAGERGREVICKFDYLDPADGAIISVLHTGASKPPRGMGTVRGLPAGLISWVPEKPKSRVHDVTQNARDSIPLLLITSSVVLVPGWLGIDMNNPWYVLVAGVTFLGSTVLLLKGLAILRRITRDVNRIPKGINAERFL